MTRWLALTVRCSPDAAGGAVAAAAGGRTAACRTTVTRERHKSRSIPCRRWQARARLPATRSRTRRAESRSSCCNGAPSRRQHDHGRRRGLFLRHVAASTRRLLASPGRADCAWDAERGTFTRLDNVNGDALYTLEGAVFNTGTANSTRDLHAASGWDGSTLRRYAFGRAVRDSRYRLRRRAARARRVARTPSFPPLQLHWSTANVPASGPRYPRSRYRRDRHEPLSAGARDLSARRPRTATPTNTIGT